MKKFMYMCMMLLAATLTFTACGSDDDDNGNNGGNNGGNGGNNQNEVVQDNYYKYQDSFNFQGVGTMTMIGEATFQSGKCTAIAITYIYPTKSFASQVWKSYQEDEDMKSELPNYSYDGDKTIVYRFDSETVASYSQSLDKQGICDLIKYTVQTTMSRLSDSISK